ncbi:MAG TPA: hypothetical protein VFY27_11650, partial [Woeseiaceae bacterium]|nr:hypothetical protein [Woeseiaceae bacterium]
MPVLVGRAIYCGTVALLPMFISLSATAQYDADGNEADVVEEIVVTGSRIKRRDFSSPSPIATI